MQKILFGATLVAFGILFGCDQPQNGGSQASAQALPCHCKPAAAAPAATPHVLHREIVRHWRYAHAPHRGWTKYAGREGVQRHFHGRRRWTSDDYAAGGMTDEFHGHRHWARNDYGTGGMTEESSSAWQSSGPAAPQSYRPGQADRGPKFWVDGFGRRYYAVAARSSYPADDRTEMSPWHGWYAGCDQYNDGN